MDIVSPRPTAATKRSHHQAFESDDPRDDVVEPTATNPLGIPGAPPYQIIFVKNQQLHDVVDPEDLDYVRKLTQVAWRFYKGKRTAKMYISYDEADCAYEITWGFPGADTEVTHDIHNILYKINPMFVKKRSWTLPYADEHNELGQTLSIRVASHRCKTFRIKETHLMLWETEETITVLSEDRPDSRSSKRAKFEKKKD